MVKTVHPYGVVEIENLENGKIIKVDNQRLNPFLENFDCHESIEELVDTIYQDAPLDQFMLLLIIYSLFFLVPNHSFWNCGYSDPCVVFFFFFFVPSLVSSVL